MRGGRGRHIVEGSRFWAVPVRVATGPGRGLCLSIKSQTVIYRDRVSAADIGLAYPMFSNPLH